MYLDPKTHTSQEIWDALTIDERRMEGMRALRGGSHYPEEGIDYSFTATMRRAMRGEPQPPFKFFLCGPYGEFGPPTQKRGIFTGQLPDYWDDWPMIKDREEVVKYLQDKRRKNPSNDYWDDVPDIEIRNIYNAKLGIEEAEDMISSFVQYQGDINKDVAKAIPSVLEWCEKYSPIWNEHPELFIKYLPMTRDELDNVCCYEPKTVTKALLEDGEINAPYFDENHMMHYPRAPIKKVYEYKPMPQVKIDVEMPSKIKIPKITDTEFYYKRAYYQHQLDARDQISRDVNALKVELDRAVAEYCTLDVTREPMKVLELRNHIEQVEHEIDSYYISYGVKPRRFREPDLFESIVRKVRGAAAYIKGKVKDGLKKIKKKIEKKLPPIKDPENSPLVPILGTAIAVGVSFLRLKFGGW